MEIRKSKAETVEFKYEDVVFFIKPHATEEDRMIVNLSGAREGDRVVFSRSEYCKTIIKCMVTGWKGVTEDGKEVPYSFDLLSNFPRVKDRNVYIDLGSFIIENTDIARTPEDGLKKD